MSCTSLTLPSVWPQQHQAVSPGPWTRTPVTSPAGPLPLQGTDAAAPTPGAVPQTQTHGAQLGSAGRLHAQPRIAWPALLCS